MAHMLNTIENTARFGANIEISTDAKLVPNKLIGIVRIARSKGSHLTIHASNYMPLALQKIARFGGDDLTIRC